MYVRVGLFGSLVLLGPRPRAQGVECEPLPVYFVLDDYVVDDAAEIDDVLELLLALLQLLGDVLQRPVHIFLYLGVVSLVQLHIRRY